MSIIDSILNRRGTTFYGGRSPMDERLYGFDNTVGTPSAPLVQKFNAGGDSFFMDPDGTRTLNERNFSALDYGINPSVFKATYGSLPNYMNPAFTGSKAQNVIDNTEENYLKASGLINQVGRSALPQQQQKTSSGIGGGLLKFAQSPFGGGFAEGLLKASQFSPRPVSFAEALGSAMETGSLRQKDSDLMAFEREKFNEQKAQNIVANFLANKKLDIDQQKLLQPQLSNFTKSLIAAGIEPSSDQGIALLEKELAKASTTIDLGNKTDEAIKLETFKMDRKTIEEDKKLIRGQKEMNAKLGLMKNILEKGDIDTGVFTNIRKEILGIAAAFNLLDESELNELENLQSFEALASYIIPRMRAIGSGATSDFEVRMYTRAAPNIVNTVNGNLKIIAGFQQVNQYNIDKSKAMEKWFRDNKSLDGFEDDWEQKTGDQVFPQYTDQESFDELIKSGKLQKNQYVIYNPTGKKFSGELIFYTGEEQ